MLTAFTIAAMEMCFGATLFDDCVAWMVQCQEMEIETQKKWMFDDSLERCFERLPLDLTAGM
jgi:hypothetical protein